MCIYFSWILCLFINIVVIIYYIINPFHSNKYTDEAIGTITHVEQSTQRDSSTEYIVYHSTIVFTDKKGIEHTVYHDNKVISALIAPPYIDIEKKKKAVDLDQKKDYVGKTELIAYNENNPEKFKVGGFSGSDKLVYVDFTFVILNAVSILFAIYDTRKKRMISEQS